MFECFAILRRLGLVAQSVEQRIENPCVGGSIPPRATKKVKSSPIRWGAFFWPACPYNVYIVFFGGSDGILSSHLAGQRQD